MARKTKARFNRIDSGIAGVKSFKPNEAMQCDIAMSMPDEILKDPLMAQWKALKEKALKEGGA